MSRQLVDGRCRVRQGLGHKFIQTQLLHPHTERLGVQQRVCNLRPVGVGRGAAIAGDKILGAFQHHADAAKGVKVKADGLNNDLHATAAYRAHLVSVMAARAVAAAS